MSVVRLHCLIPTSPSSRFAESHESKAPWSLDLRQGPYLVRLATSEADRMAAFRLRFLVFNLELNEGLEKAYVTGHDTDQFDAFCDHLIVEDLRTENVVGTYRLQSGSMAVANAGFYSEQEFNFNPYRSLNDKVIELGRACVHRDHRSTDVLYLLWRAIAKYAARLGGRYLIGCSSLTSQDPAHGAAVYAALQEYLVEPKLRTVPQPEFAVPAVPQGEASNKVPKLLRTYLAIGAKICGPPAIDREFKTIDFLTLVDLKTLHPRVQAHFLKA
jgi:putative hemolysin